MKEQGRIEGQQSLEALGIRNVNTVWWNLNTPALYEHALQRHEALLARQGPLVVRTGRGLDSIAQREIRTTSSVVLGRGLRFGTGGPRQIR